MFDLIVRNGLVIDGSGQRAFRADIGIRDSQVKAVGVVENTGSPAIDASGLTVCPGFIDMHSHSDLSILAHNKAESSLSQGITTEVIGSCGWSMAPVKSETQNSVLKGLLTGLVNRKAYESPDWDWHSLGQFMDKLTSAGTGTNLAPQVGQSLLRAHVVGTAKRKATPGELDAMKCLLREAMEEGAWGMSTGRSYRPGVFAPDEEILELAKVVAAYDGIYTTHMKSEGDHLLEAVEETLSIAKHAQVRTNVSHHKAVGKKHFGKVDRTLEMLEEARSQGLLVSADAYPYEFAQASSVLGLLPGTVWRAAARIKQGGKAGPETAGPAGSLEQLDPPTHEEILRLVKDTAVMQGTKSSPEFVVAARRLGNYAIVRCPSFPDLEGWILEDYCAEKGQDITELLCFILLEDGFGVWGAWPIAPDDMRKVFRADFVMTGTDAFALDRPIDPTPIHPRHYGSFPRVVGRFVREGLFSAEEAVRKCTSLPAETMGIPKRGYIRAGYWADLVIFDQRTLEDAATARDPYLRSKGIEWVLVNGKVAFEKGKATAAQAGKVLRRGQGD